MIQLWEWVRFQGGGGALSEWRLGLEKTDRAILDSKLNTLEAADDTGRMPGFIAGPIKHKGTKYEGIYKLQAGGKLRLRPMLCKGPQDLDREVTFLVGAFEKGNDFEPKDAPGKAVERRTLLVHRRAQRRRYEPWKAPMVS